MTRPASNEPEGQNPDQGPDQVQGKVLPFRPRGSPVARNIPRPLAVPDPSLDLEKYERIDGQPDDFRHRMLMNGLGLAVAALLVVAGIWIADVIANMRKNQDCVLTGRPGCTPVDAPLQRR